MKLMQEFVRSKIGDEAIKNIAIDLEGWKWGI